MRRAGLSALGRGARRRAGSGRGRRRGRSDPRRSADRAAARLRGRGGQAAAADLARAAPPPVHGAERAQQHPQRRLPDRRLPGRGPARSRDDGELHLPAGRLRVGHLRLARAASSRSASASMGPTWRCSTRAPSRRWPRWTCRRATRAEADLHRLHRRRLLLPRQPRPGDLRHQLAAPDGGRRRDTAGGGVALVTERDYDLTAGRAQRRQDHLRAARLLRPDLVRVGRRCRRHHRPGDRRGADPPARRGDRQLVRRRRQRGRLHRHRPRPLPLRRRPPTAHRGHVAAGLSQLGDLQAGPGRTPARAPRRR